MSRKDLKYRGTQCINCETSLDISEKYCHHCGQLNSTKKLTVIDFIEEFFANFYAYDSRLRNSIVSIFTKPGVLAKEFNEGKRHTYANPFRLFLSVSIVLFLTYNLVKKEEVENKDQSTQQVRDSISSLSINDKFTIKKVPNLNGKLFSKDSIYTKTFIDKNMKNDIVYYITSFRNFHIKYPEKEAEVALKELEFENTYINRLIFNKTKSFKSNNITEELFDYFYQKLPFFIFLSLPILTFIFCIVFYSKNINYTEHLVFSYTFFTFMFLCMITFNLINIISETMSDITAGFSFLILFPLYFYKSLTNFYKQSRWKTILKFILLIPLFTLFLIICMSFIMFLGFILF